MKRTGVIRRHGEARQLLGERVGVELGHPALAFAGGLPDLGKIVPIIFGVDGAAAARPGGPRPTAGAMLD